MYSQLIHSPAWSALGWTMLHFLWIGTLIGVMAFVGRLALRRCAPQARYIFLTVSFFLMAAAPWPVLWLLLTEWQAGSAGETRIVEEQPFLTLGTEAFSSEPPRNQTISLPNDSLLTGAANVPSTEVDSYPNWNTWLDEAAVIAPWIWLMGTPLTSLLVCCGFAGTRRLRRNSRILTEEEWVMKLSQRLRQALHIGREVVIAVNEKAVSPILVGVVKPVILLPPSLVAGCTPEQMEMILLHELAHVRRWDSLVNLAQRIIECMLFFHPLVWTVSRWIREEREACCDEIVLHHTGAPYAYAETLAILAVSGGGLNAAAALPMARHPLVHRIRRILGLEDKSLRFPPFSLASITILLVAGLAVAIGTAQDKKDPEVVRDNSVAQERLMHFPSGASLGTIHTREPRNNSVEWKLVGEAKGEVPVPTNQKIALMIYPEKVRGLAALAQSTLQHVDELWIRGGILDNDALNILGQLNEIERLRLQNSKVRVTDTRSPARLPGFNRLEFYSVSTTGAILPFLASPSEMRSLVIYQNPELRPDDVDQIYQLLRLEELTLTGRSVEVVDLSRLSQLPALRELTLNDDSIDDLRLEQLRGLTPLKKLDLSGAKITDAGLTHLSSLVRLESLNLSKCEITDAGVKHLVGLPLRVLNLRNTKVTDAGCADLARIKTLESLALPDEFITDAGLAHIAQLSNLKELSVPRQHYVLPADDRNHYTGAGLELLTSLQGLEKLDIAGLGVTDAGLKSVARLSRLRKLSLFGCAITDRGLVELRRLTGLESLRIDFAEVTISGVSALNGLPNLVRLEIDNIHQDHSGLDLSALQRLDSLTLSTAEGSSFVDQDLTSLEKLKQLRSLQLVGTRGVGDQGFAHLRGLTRLEFLNTGGSELTDAGMAYLSDLTNLLSLNLSAPGVTAEGAKHLTALPKLEQLRIIGNFTDAALPYFAELTSLRHLQVYSPRRISSEAIQRLKERLPEPRYVSVEAERSMQSKSRLRIGDTAPEFTVATLGGEEINLKDYRGKAVLLHFWGTWCTPCMASAPELKQFHDELAAQYGDRFAMISLAMDEEAKLGTIRKLVDTYEMTWPQARIGELSRIATDYGVVGAPTFFVVNPDGKIVSTSRDESVIRAVVAKASKDANTTAGVQTVSESPDNAVTSTEHVEKQVTIRLIPEKPRWQLGERPVIRAIIDTDGSPRYSVPSSEASLEVEWDGSWYVWTGRDVAATTLVPSTSGIEGIRIRLERNNWGVWIDRTKHPQPLQVSFGKHPLRVAAFIAQLDESGRTIERRVVSDPIDIEIHDDAGIGAIVVESTSETQSPSPTASQTQESNNRGDSPQATTLTQIGVGDRLPSFSLTNLAGEPVKLEEYMGKVTLVHFWATWCGPCISELPIIQETYQKFHKQGFDIVSFSLDVDRHQLEQFLDEEDHAMPWQHIWLTEGAQSPIWKEYGLHALPSVFLLDREGTVRSTSFAVEVVEAALQVDRNDPLTLENQVAALLAVNPENATTAQTAKGWIAGQIRGIGTDSVEARLSQISPADPNNAKWLQARQPEMDEQGHYRFVNVPAGQYRLDIESGGMSGEREMTTLRVPVSVDAFGLTKWINVDLNRGSSSLEVICPGLYAVTIRGNWAELNGTIEKSKYLDRTLNDGAVHSEGHVFSNLPAGSYQVSGVRQDGKDNVLVSRAVVEVAEAQQAICLVELPSITGTFRGRFIGLEEPASDWVMLIRERGAGPIESAEVYEASTMDSVVVIRGRGLEATGEFECNRVPVGRYTLTVAKFQNAASLFQMGEREGSLRRSLPALR